MQQELDNLKLRQDTVETQMNTLTNSVQKVVIGIDSLVKTISEQSNQLGQFNIRYEYQKDTNDEIKRSVERVWASLDEEIKEREATSEEVVESRLLLSLIEGGLKKLSFILVSGAIMACGTVYVAFKIAATSGVTG